MELAKMELLHKALFNLPRANEHATRSLDKVALSQLYGANSAAVAAAAAAGGHIPAPILNSLAAAAAHTGGAGGHAPLLNNLGVEPVSPGLVFEVASTVLYASHAIPVRIKILMDRLFSVISQEEMIAILKNFGWTLEDYQRGYILKDPRGAPLDRWHMCSKEEEPLVLQQFLRFGETRPITQQLLLQELTEKSTAEQRARAQIEIKKFFEHNAMATAAAAALAAANAQQPQGPPGHPLGRQPMHQGNNNNNNGQPQQLPQGPPSQFNLMRNSLDLKDRGDVSPARSHPSPGGAEVRSASVSSPSNASSSAMVSPSGGGMGGGGGSHMSSHPMSSPPTSTTPSSINGGSALPPSSPLSSSSPLNRLQNMQPFDYRKAGERKTPDISRPLPANMRVPPNSMAAAAAAAAAAAGLVMPLMSNANIPHPLASYHNSLMANSKTAGESRHKGSGSDENSAINISTAGSDTSSRGDGERSGGGSNKPERQRERRRAPSSPLSVHGDPVLNHELKKKFRDNLGVSFVSPTTGKKRVQCNVCLKTFCDKGALKIHFSAVHLREMHKCTVDGCNMLFSSRRSRNRHSANPNPKLHTPHLRRKISPHDGRTHQGPYLPGLAVAMASQQQQQMSPKSFRVSPHLGNSPFAMLPPEFRELQRHQAELQRLQEMNQQMYEQHHLDSKQDSPLSDIAAKRGRFSDSDNENDDAKSTDNASTKDEAATVSAHGGGAGGRKRKSQNPTRITTTTASQKLDTTASLDRTDEEGFSSDDDDEGFENPLDDNDSGDDLVDSGDDDDDDDDDQLGGAGGGLHRGRSHGGNDGGDNHGAEDDDDNKGRHDDRDQRRENGSGKKHNDDLSDAAGDIVNNNNNVEKVKSDESSFLSAPESPLSTSLHLLGEIPVDKEDPKRCVECRQEFRNHFELKQHFQNVHLNFLHKCTIEGCNAGFPSKRSRDRHSSNFNLHRKLLSTTSDKSEKASSSSSSFSMEGDKSSALMQSAELLARLYNEQHQAAAAFESSKQQLRSPNFFQQLENDFPAAFGMGLQYPGILCPSISSASSLFGSANKFCMKTPEEIPNHT